MLRSGSLNVGAYSELKRQSLPLDCTTRSGLVAQGTTRVQDGAGIAPCRSSDHKPGFSITSEYLLSS